MANGNLDLETQNGKSIINTCSIDYFLIIIYYLTRKEINFTNIAWKDISQKICFNINSKRWYEARISWITFNMFPKEINSTFNCFSSLYDAYASIFLKTQSFKRTRSCTNNSCINFEPVDIEESGFSFM